MCCITIDTEVLFANFFGSPEYQKYEEQGATPEILEKCAILLSNNLPGYVFYDLTEKKILEVIKKNPGYKIEVNEEIFYRGQKINREYYNNIYTPMISERIKSVVDTFFNERLYEKKIVPLALIHS